MDSEDTEEEPGGDSVGAGTWARGREGYRMPLAVELVGSCGPLPRWGALEERQVGEK